MKVFVRVSGSITDGLDSPTRGEGRWTLNMARVLADAGHKVIISCESYSTWGSSPRHPNVEIVQWENVWQLRDIVFDVYFTVNHIPGEAYPVKAKVKMSGFYSLGGLILEPEVSRVQDDIYILAPERQTHKDYLPILNEKNIKWKDRYKLCCQPYGKEFGKNRFKNKTIVFSAKEVFHPTIRKYHEDAKKNIFAAIDACKITGSRFVVVSCEWDKPDYYHTVRRLGIFNKLSELENKKLLPIVPWKQLMSELSSSSILMPLGFAGCMPDGIFAGLVPLLRSDRLLARHPDHDIESIVSDMGDSKDMTQDQIRDLLVRLLSDESYYNSIQERIQKIMTDHLDENVLKQFYDIIEYEEKERNK